jgi:ubiquinone/menaquinone biosynthesis C-methylase UbiE
MPAKISEMINRHQYPGVLYKSPAALKIYHFLNNIVTLRNWYVKNRITKLLKVLPAPFHMYDAGCGSGDMLLPYAGKYKESLFTGTDKIADNVELCQAFTRQSALTNCHFTAGNIEAYITEQPVDLLTCITVLQYCENDLQALNCFYKSLKPNGILLLYVPVNYKRVFKWFNKLRAVKNKNVDYDSQMGIYHHYTISEISDKLKDAGFIIKKTITAYKTSGKIAFELFSSFLTIVKILPSFAGFIIFPVFAIIYPIMLLFMIFDLFERKREGNGVLLIAAKHETI